MGTNYYYIAKPPCECCQRPYPEVHIGKASAGWKFMLYGGDRSETWAKIKERILSAHSVYDEYGAEISPAEMVEIVEGWQEGRAHCDSYPRYSWRDPEGYIMNENDFT